MFPELARDDVFRLETPRLWLRWPRAADAPALAALANDWDVARHTAFLPHPYDAEDARSFVVDSRLGNALGRHLRLALTLKTGDRAPIGVIGLEPDGKSYALGYWLGRPYWGRGFAREAAQAMVDAFFRVMPKEELLATVLPENAASAALLTQTGFRPAGQSPAPGRHRGEKALRFALNRESWRAA